ncbi:MAG: hypothetical protein EPO02_13505 [Nitrospirae bacterium]|nr:MAG: hypothetical protein EPO02_13505 [Nitrospirota bacterium]
MSELPSEYEEQDRTLMVKDPILMFVLDGVRYAVEQNTMTWAEAKDKVTEWFPDAQIVLEHDQQAE